MCLAIPGKIVSVESQQAVVDFDGVKKEVNISLIGNVKKGEYVIVHAGFAIEKVDKKRKLELDEMLSLS